MTDPKRAVPTKAGRYYRDPKDGTLYPSATNVIDTALAKPALKGWAAKVTAEAAVANLPELVRRCRTDRSGAAAWLKGQPFAALEAAGALGTQLHDLAEAHVLGKPLTAPDADGDAGLMLANFAAFLQDFRPQYEAAEMTVVNRTVGYAGTLDALARIPAVLDGALCVVDYKTGATGPYPEWALQVGAYARGEAAWLKDGTEVAMPKVSGGLILRIRPNGYALHQVRPDAMDALAETFAAMVTVTRWAHAATDNPVIGPRLEPAELAGAVA